MLMIFLFVFGMITEFKDNPDLYVFPKLKYVGIELWQVKISCVCVCVCLCFIMVSFLAIGTIFQVKSGTLFDNVLITDDPDYAKKLAEETWGKQKDVCDLFRILNLTFHLFQMLYPAKRMY